MTHYVLGFAFTEAYQQVLLYRKPAQTMHEDLWNGVGGHIEKKPITPADRSGYEHPHEAMVREGIEETDLPKLSWREFAELRFDNGNRVHVFKVVVTPSTRMAPINTRCKWFNFEHLALLHPSSASALLAPHVLWLIALARESHEHGTPVITFVDPP